MRIEFNGYCDIDDGMNDEERLWKALYHGQGDSPRTLPKAMEEQDFFDFPYDVSVVPHGRYTPLFLHEHEFIEMVFVFRGQCVNEIMEKKVSMASGDICLIAPGTKHTLGVFDDETFVLNFLIRTSTFETSFFNILSGTSILADFFRHIFYSSEGSAYILFHTGEDSRLRYYLGEIYRESREAQPDKNAYMDTVLTLFFLLLLRDYGSTVALLPEEKDGSREEINPVVILKYMQENYCTVSLKGMSAHFHYSERHMKRIIARCTGRSFSENILRLRMNEAVRLLEKTHLSASDIALKVGYSDVSGFRQAFRKYYGKSPGQWRKV